MKEYLVTRRISGVQTYRINAETEEEAVAKVLASEYDIDDCDQEIGDVGAIVDVRHIAGG